LASKVVGTFEEFNESTCSDDIIILHRPIQEVIPDIIRTKVNVPFDDPPSFGFRGKCIGFSDCDVSKEILEDAMRN